MPRKNAKQKQEKEAGHATDWHKIQNPVYKCAVCGALWNTLEDGPLPKRHGE